MPFAKDEQTQLTFPVRFGRARTIQVLAMLSGVTALIALIVDMSALGIGKSWDTLVLLTAAIGFLVSSAFLYLSSYLFSAAMAWERMLWALFSFGATAAWISTVSIPQVWVGPLSGVAVLGALLLYFYEQGLKVEFTEHGLLWMRRFPTPRRIFIPWSEVETVTANMRRITSDFAVHEFETEHQQHFIICGGGERITFGTPRYRFLDQPFLGVPRWADLLLELAAPAAIAWTVGQIQTRGHVRLGPVEVTRDGVTVWELRWVRTHMKFAELRDVGFEDGEVRFDTATGQIRVPIKKVPNGVFLPNIVRAMVQ